ncbi:hypothetical protein Scep_019372 [Stephania cephalantha]|uniref:Uncharacterized protein n=1 Tax=Stephania cephalantha TaxID=152367 RepID=A0AAP0IAP3_9MAGN
MMRLCEARVISGATLQWRMDCDTWCNGKPANDGVTRGAIVENHQKCAYLEAYLSVSDHYAELTRRLEEMSTQTPDTSIDEDAVYLEVVPKVKGRVYGLGSQGYHRSISLGEVSSSRGPAYGPHELEELQWDHQRLQETLLKERMERQEQMRERQDGTPRRKMRDAGPDTADSTITDSECYGPQSDDQPGHLTTDIAPSQSAHPVDHQPGHWTDPHISLPEDQRHLLDDHDEFMSQLTPPPRPPPRQ